MFYDYYCCDSTEGGPKYYNLVIPKEFKYGYMHLNQEDWESVKQFLIDDLNQTEEEAESTINDVKMEMANNLNIEPFTLLLTTYLIYGHELTTEKELLGLYTTINEQDQENIVSFVIDYLGVTEDEAKSLIKTAVEDAEKGNYETLNAGALLYLNNGGTLTTKKGFTTGIAPFYIMSSYTNGVFGSEGLKSVVLPDSIEVVGDNAFNNNDITKLTLSENLTEIGEAAFSDNKLTSIIIPNSVSRIAMAAFSNNNLKTVQLGTDTNSNLGSIESSAFLKNNKSNPNLTKIVNKTGKAFNFYGATGSSSPSENNDSTIEKGTLINSYGNIEVVTE